MSKPLSIDLLRDEGAGGVLATMVDCKLRSTNDGKQFFSCGFATFVGGLSGEMKMISDRGLRFTIVIPKEVIEVATRATWVDQRNKVQIDVVGNT